MKRILITLLLVAFVVPAHAGLVGGLVRDAVSNTPGSNTKGYLGSVASAIIATVPAVKATLSITTDKSVYTANDTIYGTYTFENTSAFTLQPADNSEYQMTISKTDLKTSTTGSLGATRISSMAQVPVVDFKVANVVPSRSTLVSSIVNAIVVVVGVINTPVENLMIPMDLQIKPLEESSAGFVLPLNSLRNNNNQPLLPGIYKIKVPTMLFKDTATNQVYRTTAGEVIIHIK